MTWTTIIMIVHTHRMAGEKRNPLGPTGETVRANLRRLREAKNLGYIKLARMLEEIGRPIPDLGLRRIESGDRRVDVDDLVALAAALGVSPVTLLMPGMSSADAPKMVEVAAADLSIGRLWRWLRADIPLPTYPLPQRRFFADARPEWDPGAGEWIKDTADGDD